jgi:hypothetical protein
VVEWLTPLIRSWEVLGSSVGRRPAIVTKVFVVFLGPFRQIYLKIRVRPLRSKFFLFIIGLSPLHSTLYIVHSFTGAYCPGRTFGLPFGVS